MPIPTMLPHMPSRHASAAHLSMPSPMQFSDTNSTPLPNTLSHQPYPFLVFSLYTRHLPLQDPLRTKEKGLAFLVRERERRRGCCIQEKRKKSKSRRKKERKGKERKGRKRKKRKERKRKERKERKGKEMK